MRSVKLYFHYCKLSILKALEYRSSFFVGLFGLIMINGVSLLLIWVMLSNFHTLNGWNFWEIMLNYSMFLACLGFHNVFFKHLGDLEDYILEGTFDRFLLRPCSTFLQLIGDKLSVPDISDFMLGLFGIILSYLKLKLHWAIGKWFLLLFYLCNGILIFTILLLAISSLSFWIIKSSPFLYGTIEIQESVQHYPISIFGKGFKFIVSIILPYALINYYPSMVLLGKVKGNYILRYFIFTVVITLIFLNITIVLWKKGIDHYQSTGS